MKAHSNLVILELFWDLSYTEGLSAASVFPYFPLALRTPQSDS
jgi:hypothetical protein